MDPAVPTRHLVGLKNGCVAYNGKYTHNTDIVNSINIHAFQRQNSDIVALYDSDVTVHTLL